MLSQKQLNKTDLHPYLKEVLGLTVIFRPDQHTEILRELRRKELENIKYIRA